MILFQNVSNIISITYYQTAMWFKNLVHLVVRENDNERVKVCFVCVCVCELCVYDLKQYFPEKCTLSEIVPRPF